ncbi:hypothetical protein TNCV_4661691 [Trichonephila clavipes]|uniref:Uncharacterized protein n=1 Tax=Trichonephila clavipes TaxID=2585209 RepID=A0A8X6VIH4_TRICX|nr:hypothetical protein TNCV_4661691 [Trichonephila clavipes]
MDLVILNNGQVTRTTPDLTPPLLTTATMGGTTPELAPSSPNYHTTPTGGRLSSRQIQRASLPYTKGLQWYWARTHHTSHESVTLTTRLLRSRTNGRTLSLDRFNMHRPSIHRGSSVAPVLEPVTFHPRVQFRIKVVEELLHIHDEIASGQRKPGRPPTVDNSTRLTERHFTSHIPPTSAKHESTRQRRVCC